MHSKKKLIKSIFHGLGLLKEKNDQDLKGGITMESSTLTTETSICAIVCVRNESAYLPGLIEHLRQQFVDIAFIDNDSTDGSREIMESHIGGSVLSIRDLEYNGAFSLSGQLQAKAEVEQKLKHDWILHVDADEIHHASSDGDTLLDVVKKATKAGCNAVNFEEFVFLPESEKDSAADFSHLKTLRYYYFAPLHQRLVRLYRRGQGLDNRASGGHRVKGNPVIYPQTQVLRHYIGLNEEHLKQKYIGRIFDSSELSKGWHGNRVNITAEMLSLSRFGKDWFDYLPHAESRAFVRNRPRRRHFWSA